MRTCSIYLLLLLAGIFASCDDFLDQSPKYNLTLENAVTDYNGAKNIVNGMYSVIAKSSSHHLVSNTHIVPPYIASQKPPLWWGEEFFSCFIHLYY